MICVDSNFLIDFARNDKNAIRVFQKYRRNIVTTEINKFEVMIGFYYKKSSKTIQKAERFLSKIQTLPSSKGFGRLGAKIFAELSKKRLEMEKEDCLIIALMLLNGCTTIITKNKKHFERVKGIKVINY